MFISNTGNSDKQKPWSLRNKKGKLSVWVNMIKQDILQKELT